MFSPIQEPFEACMYVCHEMNAVKREFLKADQDLIGVHLT